MTYGNITDVSGILVGHAVLPGGYRGCTVVIADGGAVAAVDVRGGAPGTRETDALNLGGLVGRVDAVLLTGGSAFGLAAADGVMRALEERGQGYAIGGARVPIVAAAVLFDLAVGDPSLRPRAEDGWRAVASATVGPFAFGNTGAGAGATVGKALGRERAVKGGLGSASQRLPGGATVGALAVVNSLGEVRDPATGRVLAGPRGDDGGFVDSVRALTEAGLRPDGPAAAGNTTLVVVATDAVLDRRGVERMAVMAHDGLARAVRPAHTAYDGDVAFALATGRAGVAVEASVLGAVAADLVAAAICTAVLHAQPLCGIPAACGRGLPPSGGEE